VTKAVTRQGQQSISIKTYMPRPVKDGHSVVTGWSQTQKRTYGITVSP